MSEDKTEQHEACDVKHVEAMEIDSKASQIQSVGWKKQIAFNVSLVYNFARHNRKSRPWWSRVNDFIVLGALPMRDKHHLKRLTEEYNVKAVVTMNERYELAGRLYCTPVTPDDWKDAGVLQHFGDTPDFKPPTAESIDSCVEFIASNRERGSVYVHCKAGRGRSTVAVMSYLVKYEHMSPTEGLAFIKTKRPHVSVTKNQFNSVENYALFLSTRG